MDGSTRIGSGNILEAMHGNAKRTVVVGSVMSDESPEKKSGGKANHAER